MPSKRILLKIHRWCGLAFCLWVALQALTGSALLFRQELARALDPAGMVRHTAGGQAPLSTVLDNLRAGFPDYQTQRIVWPQQAADVYFAHMADANGHALYASVDPGDGRILRSGGLWTFPMEGLLAVHLRLLTGKVGLAVVFLGGLSILGQMASGWAYWWPKRGRVRNALKIGWSLPPRALLRQLHRTTGLAASLIVLVIVPAGLLVAGEYLVEPGPLTSTSPARGGPAPSAGVDQAFAAAQALHPGRGLRDVRMPKPGLFNACFWAPERSALAVDTVKTVLPEGRVTGERRARDDNSLWVTFLPIHTGEALGLPGRLIQLAGALALAALAITGPVMWWHRKSKA
jgi:uncharacterized iron-regulated membrane protein